MADYSARRTVMVDTQVRPSDVTKFPIIDAMLAVPREHFVPTDKVEAAYVGENIDLGLGNGRMILEPRTLAKMLDAVNIGPDELVLDIGAGLGYSSAVLARLAEAVVAVEEDETLASEAQTTLSDIGADNVVMHVGPLAEGAAQHGPYDAIVLQGGIEAVPDTIVDQLKDGGRVIALFMDGPLGAVRLGFKRSGQISWRFEFNASATVLPGFSAAREFSL